MSPENKNDFIDELLTAGLAHMGEVEDAPGLEQRLLASLRDKKAARESWLPRTLKIAAAMAAGGAIAISGTWLVRNVDRVQPSPIATQIRNHAEQSKPLNSSAGAISTMAHKGPAQAVPPRPKLARSRAKQLPQNALKTSMQQARPDTTPTPHLTHFPAPSPPTDAELYMARLGAETDAAKLRSLAAASHAPASKLDIDELDIPPLSISPSPESINQENEP